MGKRRNLVRDTADTFHHELTSLIGSGFKPSRSMTGAIAVISAGGDLLFVEKANYGGTDYHVEIHLLSLLYDFAKKTWGEYTLPAHSRVYLHVYDSPCKSCTEKLAFALEGVWQNGGETWLHGSKVRVARNVTVQWKLGFTEWFTGFGGGRYWDHRAAQKDYEEKLESAGWRVKQVK